MILFDTIKVSPDSLFDIDPTLKTSLCGLFALDDIKDRLETAAVAYRPKSASADSKETSPRRSQSLPSRYVPYHKRVCGRLESIVRSGEELLNFRLCVVVKARVLQCCIDTVSQLLFLKKTPDFRGPVGTLASRGMYMNGFHAVAMLMFLSLVLVQHPGEHPSLRHSPEVS